MKGEWPGQDAEFSIHALGFYEIHLFGDEFPLLCHQRQHEGHQARPFP
ncbi:MAG: hypothetical protein D084_Lepto4C00033G0002 [Leptospirillum sp. Group IV 'UBA BS']|nr:MAG: hypothetical protein D084_Lepto4C00033G0002 [Leptospirillum sp. Group IV 'UBA BS']